jgi:hypothetical protein
MRVFATWIVVASASAAAAPPGETPAAKPPGETDPIVKPPGETPPDATPPPDAPLLTTIDVDAVPEQCRTLVQRADSEKLALALSARVSLALCSAAERMRAVALCDCQQSVTDLDAAVAPSFAILDEVQGAGEIVWQVIALHAEGELLAELAARVLATIPPPLPDTSPEAIALHDTRAKMLQPLVQPWLDRSHERFMKVDELGQQHAELAYHQLADAAVKDSRRRLGVVPAKPAPAPAVPRLLLPQDLH